MMMMMMTETLNSIPRDMQWGYSESTLRVEREVKHIIIIIIIIVKEEGTG